MASESSGIDLTMVQDIQGIEAHEAAIATAKGQLAAKIPVGCAVTVDRNASTVAISDGGKLRVFALIVLSEVSSSHGA